MSILILHFPFPHQKHIIFIDESILPIVSILLLFVTSFNTFLIAISDFTFKFVYLHSQHESCV